MEPHPRGRVDVQVRVMHSMQTPEGGRVVKNAVLRVNGEIKEEQGGQGTEPRGNLNGVKQAPPSRLRQQRKTDRTRRGENPRQQRIREHDAKVIRPAPQTGNRPFPLWGQSFPDGH